MESITDDEKLWSNEELKTYSVQDSDLWTCCLYVQRVDRDYKTRNV